MKPAGAIAAVIGAAAALGMASSCFVEGFVRVESDTTAPPDDGGADVGDDADDDASQGCGHATWPSPPEESDPGADTVDVVLAADSFDLGEALEEGAVLGYDLDSHCTCQGEGPSCVAPEWATADHCDGPEGRDNAWADISKALVVFDPNLSSTAITEQVQAGELTLLVRVSSYNGQPNDDSVTVALYPSPGRHRDPCLLADGTPEWNGDDAWPVFSTALLGSGGGAGAAGSGGGGAGGGAGGGPPVDCSGGSSIPPGYDFDDPRFVDAQAYVTDSVVVANLPDVEIILADSDSGSNVRLTAGFITGRLAQDDSTGRWSLAEGLLVGRWSVTEVFRSLSTLVTGAGELVCTDHTIYPLIKSAVCKFPDIASSLGGPTTPCDAISFGMGFTARQAQFGSILVPVASPPGCPPETDPINDECD